MAPAATIPAGGVPASGGPRPAGLAGLAGWDGRDGLAGRDGELAAVASMLSRPEGSAAVFTGAAGLGKSALLRAAAGAAARDGRLVLRATGARPETGLRFAALHQLLHPLASRFALLATPQHEALLAAFGRLGDPVADMFLVALATLELLAQAGRRAGLLAVIDDLHWIDDASAEVLGFVARRIASEPVVLLAAARPGPDDPLPGAGVPARALHPLGPADAERLLTTLHPQLDERRRRVVLDCAAGNPLALSELPLAGSPTAGVAGAGREDEPGTSRCIPLTARLRTSFAAAASGLSPPARSAAVVAAASDSGELAEIAAAVAVAVPGAHAAALCPAVDAGVLVVADGAVRFEHPLLRAALYQSAGPDQRRRAHAARAEATRARPERRAWHLAAAALVPDETVAAELERSAESAGQRGAGAASAAAWARAADLTLRPGPRGRRLLRAAEASLELGRPDQAATLAASAAPLPLAPADRARLTLVRETLEPGVPGDPQRVTALTDAAAAAGDAGDVALAGRLLLAAAARAWWADPGPAARIRLAAAVRRLPVAPDDPLLLAIGGFTDPARYGDQITRHVAALAPGPVDPVSAELALSVQLVGADAAVTAVPRALAGDARRQGKRAVLPRLLTRQAWNAIAAADWAAAGPAADEAAGLAAALGQPLWQSAALAAQAMIAGLGGDEEAAGERARQAEAIALPARFAPVLGTVQLARGVTAIGAGDYEAAFDQLSRVFDQGDPSCHPVQSGWALGDLAEAAVRTARTARARKILDSFRPATGDGVAPWTRVALCYADALLAGDDRAEERFTAALRSPVARWPAYRARLLIEYGSWLRRRRRAAEARSPLRTARQVCEAHGLAPWAERARRELRAAGEASAVPGAGRWACLSPQERRIAELAAAGLSNREIGQQLYLSPRTVGSHLYRMFPKLGITARAQLAPPAGA